MLLQFDDFFVASARVIPNGSRRNGLRCSIIIGTGITNTVALLRATAPRRKGRPNRASKPNNSPCKVEPAEYLLAVIVQ